MEVSILQHSKDTSLHTATIGLVAEMIRSGSLCQAWIRGGDGRRYARLHGYRAHRRGDEGTRQYDGDEGPERKNVKTFFLRTYVNSNFTARVPVRTQEKVCKFEI